MRPIRACLAVVAAGCGGGLQGADAFPVREALVAPCPAIDAVYVYLASGAASSECLDDPTQTPPAEAGCDTLEQELVELCAAFGGWLALGRRDELHLWSDAWDGGSLNGLAFDWIGRSECTPNRPPQLLDGEAVLSIEDNVVSVDIDTPAIAGTVEATLCDPAR